MSNPARYRDRPNVGTGTQGPDRDTGIWRSWEPSAAIQAYRGRSKWDVKT